MTQTDCDLIFTKVKTKGAKKINYNEFLAALEAVAAKKKVRIRKDPAKCVIDVLYRLICVCSRVL